MSALGHKQTFAVQNGMSALPPKADMCSALVNVRFVPIADIRATSFDHLVGAADKRVGDVEAERLGGLEVDDQLDLRGLLDRQIGRLLALEYPAGVDADLTGRFRKAASVAHQAAGRGELAKLGRSRAPRGGASMRLAVRSG